MTKIGVVGVGHLGSLHSKMLAESSLTQLTGVFDTNKRRAEAVAAQHGTIPAPSLEILLLSVDAITIAASTTSHFEIAKIALEQGKHVFVEKPITETPQQAGELCKMARDRGLILQVGHIERFNPAILALDAYTIEPMFVESHRLAQFNPRGTDVAVVLDLMIHDIDVILSFVRSPVVRVDANGLAVVSESVDIANARLQFENGCVANVTASRISQRKMRKMRLFQKSEYISIDFAEGLAEVFRLVDESEEGKQGTMMLGMIDAGKVKRKIAYEQPKVKEVNSLKYELELFAETIRKGGTPVVSGEDGKRALEVANIIMEKIQSQGISF
ncbi:MAG TPA: Gfo/Idh/MocA family oxidoreductase [Bacteroidota bacterium]